MAIRDLIANIKINLSGSNAKELKELSQSVTLLRRRLKGLSEIQVGNIRKISLAAASMRRSFMDASYGVDSMSKSLRGAARSMDSYLSSTRKSVGMSYKPRFESGGLVTDNLLSKVKPIKGRISTFDIASRQLSNFRSSVKALNIDLFSLGGLLLGTGVATFGNSLIDLKTKLDSLNATYKAVTGSMEEGKTEYEWAKKTAEELGQNYVSTTKAYVKFYAATKQNLPTEEIRDIFKTFQEASLVLGMSQYDLDLVMMALEQMASKGVVSMEELRRQLGERLFGAFSLAAKSMGLTEIKFNELIKSGKLLTKDFLPKFSDEVKKTYSKEVPNALDTTRARLGMLNNAWITLQEEILKGGFGEALTKILKDLITVLKSEATIKFFNILGGSIKFITDHLLELSVILGAVFGPTLIAQIIALGPIIVSFILNPVTWIIAAVVVFMPQLIRFFKSIYTNSVFLQDVVKFISNLIKESAKEGSNIKNILDFITAGLNYITDVIAEIFNSFNSLFDMIYIMFADFIWMIKNEEFNFANVVKSLLNAAALEFGKTFERLRKIYDDFVAGVNKQPIEPEIKPKQTSPFMRSQTEPVGISGMLTSSRALGVVPYNNTSYGNVNINVNIPQGTNTAGMDKVISKGIGNGLGINFKTQNLNFSGVK